MNDKQLVSDSTLINYVLNNISEKTLTKDYGQSLHCWHEVHRVDGKLFRIEGCFSCEDSVEIYEVRKTNG